MHYHIEIETKQKAVELLLAGGVINRYAFQGIDFCSLGISLDAVEFSNCIFIGCRLTSGMRLNLNDSNTVLTSMQVPYNTFRTLLYNANTLYEGYDYRDRSTFENCYDRRIYRHYKKTGMRANDVAETLARTLHDHSMSDALHDLLQQYEETDVVAIMGGHALLRTDKVYRQVVLLSKMLTEHGKLMTSGGGPGAMEATHLGAWMAGRAITEVDEAMEMLSHFPSFKDDGWLESAFAVMKKFPQQKFCSLGIPTWLYGHEPATPFATHIAKYFENSLREDGLLTIAKGGVIYTPGSAGTMQEIFQDAVQNHYLTFGYASPMAFLGVEYWTEILPAYRLLSEMSEQGRYKNLILSISDDINEVAESILRFKPQRP